MGFVGRSNVKQSLSPTGPHKVDSGLDVQDWSHRYENVLRPTQPGLAASKSASKAPTCKARVSPDREEQMDFRRRR